MYRSKVRKACKRILAVILSLLLLLCLFPSFSLKTLAEGDDESEQSEDVIEEDSVFVLTEGSVKVGDIIKFGHYEQDGNTANGKEEIEWQVLKVESDKVLVVSKYALDSKPYNTEWEDVTWETCTLRKWLNNDFKNAAFTSAEQAKIPIVNIANKNNPKYETTGGNNTNDKIFCLGVEELELYFGSYSWYDSEKMQGYNQNLICDATQFAINNGEFVYSITESFYNSILKDKGYTSDVIGRRGCAWLLRSPGTHSKESCIISIPGCTNTFDVVWDGGIRPALYIKTDSVEPVDPSPEYPKTIEYKYKKLEPYKTTFDPNMLAESSYNGYNENLSEICAILSQAVYRDQKYEEDEAVFKQMGIEGFKTDSEGDNYRYSIGYDNMMIDGVDTAVIFIVLRGTQSLYEMGIDATSAYSEVKVGGKNYNVYDYCTEFAPNVMAAIETVLNENANLRHKPIKFVFTGHSLGGATANYIGAIYTNKVSAAFNPSDVFVYTFGSIDCLVAKELKEKGTISSEYENIHNIYNFHDTFGPNGWWLITTKGNSGYGKYGHIDIFEEKIPGITDDNHQLIPAYFPAIFGRKVKHEKNKRVVAMHCPVDINAYKDGELVAKVSNSIIDDSVTSIPVKVIDDEKFFLIDEESDYQFEITATNEGSMEYEVLDAATGSNSKEFQDIQLTPGKTMVSFVDSETENEDVKLLVENESGKIVTEVLEDGQEIPATVQSIFKDVKEDAWYVPHVQYAYDKDLMTGKKANIFAPNANLLREEFTQIIYKNEGKPELTVTDNPFADVKNAWYKDSVLWAKENGIVSGKSADRFGIGKNITREELALMLYKYAQYKNCDISVKASTDLSGYTDVDKVSGWALTAVKWSVERGIISGKGNATTGYRIDPGKGATRAECAAMMKKFAEVCDDTVQMTIEDEEEPLALPEEETEEVPVPEEEMEDIVDEEDSEEEDSEEEITDEEEPSEMEPEDEADIKFEE